MSTEKKPEDAMIEAARKLWRTVRTTNSDKRAMDATLAFVDECDRLRDAAREGERVN